MSLRNSVVTAFLLGSAVTLIIYAAVRFERLERQLESLVPSDPPVEQFRPISSELSSDMPVPAKLEVRIAAIEASLERMEIAVRDLQQSKPAISHSVETRSPRHQSLEQQTTGLNEDFQLDPIDGEWAPQKQSEISAALAELSAAHPDLNVEIKRMECRSTVCLLETNHAGEQDRYLFDLEFTRRVSGGFSNIMTVPVAQPDDSISTRYYMLREGSGFSLR